MSMTAVNGRIYVARIIGGASNQEVLDMADEAILRAYQDWQSKKFWRFLLKDTSATTPVSATVTKSSAVVPAPSTGAFDFVNVGQEVTYAGAAGTLAAGTTVSSITRGTDGVVTQITLSSAFGGGSYTTETGTLTFSADIPILAGVNEYNLPLDFGAAATCRFTSNTKKCLTWRTQEYWDRIITDQTVQGTPEEFTTYNPCSELTQNYGETRMRFDRIPSAADTCQLRYYRKFNTTGTYLDIHDDYLYKFLDYARSLLLEAKRAQDDPAGYRDAAIDSLEQAGQSDEGRTSEDDADSCIKSQYEMGEGARRLWGNGDFEPFRS